MAKRPRSQRSRSLVPADRGAKSLPAELSQVIATTANGRDITRPYTTELEEFRDQRLIGALDWGVYDRILLDDQVKSCLEQRRSAVVSREWSVSPGHPTDPRAQAAADALEANLLSCSWDRVTDKMLRAPFYGIAVAELSWGPWQWEGRTLWGWVPAPKMRPIHVRHARRFRYDKDGRLRLITLKDPMGEIMPDRKFWVVTAGADDDDQPYGRGLAEWLYWPTLFKRNGLRFWNTFLDKFAVPTAKGTYRPGTPREDIERLLDALQSIANDTGFVIPEGMAVDLLHVATAGVDFDKMPSFMNAAITKIILCQTMTTDSAGAGLGSNQSDVQAGVKQELVVADADLLTDSFTAGPARWFTDYNFGADVAAPIVTRLVEEEEDTNTAAETDAKLAQIGWVRTEESQRDLYGDGYVREEPKQPLLPGRNPTGREQLLLPAPDEADFAEGTLAGDIVDQAVAQVMAEEGWRVGMAPIVEQLLAELLAAGSEEEVAAILARAAELDDEAAFTEALARSAFASAWRPRPARMVAPREQHPETTRHPPLLAPSCRTQPQQGGRSPSKVGLRVR
ncbi:MAG TPA: DUF935 family protein [Allosphingosinicella sp.]|jgi:phage gp29-like protein